MLFGYTYRALFSKYLSLTRNCEENRFFLHKFLLEELPVHVCQLLDGAQAVEVLCNVNASTVEMDTGDVGVFNQKLQYADNGLTVAEDR